MSGISKFVLPLACGLLVAGCSELWPSLDSKDPAAPTQRVEIPPSHAERVGTPSAPSQLRTAEMRRPRAIQPAPTTQANATQRAAVANTGSTGTFVGNKVTAMRGDLGKLSGRISELNNRLRGYRDATAASSQKYHALMAQMNAKLQTGTTPGNPTLVNQLKEGQQQIEVVAENISNLNDLSSDVDAEAGTASWLLDSVRATYALSGAVDLDHVRLRALEDEVNQGVVLIDRLLNELSADVSRQTTYVNNERHNLQLMSLAIKNGELYGSSLVNRAFSQNQARTAARIQSSPTPQSTDRPLVVIRFDRPNVPYQRALYTAVSRALDRKPDATFQLVAVSPQTGTPARTALNKTAAKRNAEGVLRALAGMGLPGHKVSLSATTSNDAENNEVRIFVR
ncbi:MAG: hypothetical protein ACPGQV_06770 [Alphaproteobacteria bacterium]